MANTTTPVTTPATSTTAPVNIKGTRTEQRLVMAYISESTAYTRYTYYMQQANKEQLPTIAQIFQVTAANELHHCKVFFKYLQGGQVSVPVSTDAGVIGTTAENLALAANEEQEEGVNQYMLSAQIAREEGFDDIASHFEAIASIEKNHEARFRKYLKRLQEGTLYKRELPIVWQCLVCGYEYVGTTPPEKCPACNHPQYHFMPKDDETNAEAN